MIGVSLGAYIKGFFWKDIHSTPGFTTRKTNIRQDGKQRARDELQRVAGLHGSTFG